MLKLFIRILLFQAVASEKKNSFSNLYLFQV